MSVNFNTKGSVPSQPSVTPTKHTSISTISREIDSVEQNIYEDDDGSDKSTSAIITMLDIGNIFDYIIKAESTDEVEDFYSETSELKLSTPELKQLRNLYFQKAQISSGFFRQYLRSQ